MLALIGAFEAIITSLKIGAPGANPRVNKNKPKKQTQEQVTPMNDVPTAKPLSSMDELRELPATLQRS